MFIKEASENLSFIQNLWLGGAVVQSLLFMASLSK